MNVRSILLVSVFSRSLIGCNDMSGLENKPGSKVTGSIDYSVQQLDRHEETPGIAQVGDSSISLDLLRYYLAQKGYGSTSKALDKESLKKVLEEVVSLEMYKQEAIKKQLDKDPATMLAMTRLLSSKYQAEVLANNSRLVKVADDEIAEAYEDEAENYVIPARRRGAIISVRLNKDAGKQDREIAKQKINEALKESSALKKDQQFFGGLAARFSDDIASKNRRGDIGWVVEGASINRYESSVVSALFSLSEEGDVSSVVKGERGYYLVRLVDIAPEKRLGLEQVKREIHRNLLKEKRHALEVKIIDDLKEQYEVSINESLMDDFISQVNTNQSDVDNVPPMFPVSVKTK